MPRRKDASITLSLFGTDAPTEEPQKEKSQDGHPPIMAAAPELKWSFSKRGVLEQCPRKFYYQYYGANRHKAKNEPAKERLHKLRLAGNRHTRTGEIMHLVIADYLRKAQQGRPWDRQQWLDWARKIFERDIAHSREGLEAPWHSYRRHPPQFLVEFLHEPEAQALCKEALAEMLAALTSFLDAPAFAAVRDLGMEEGALIEKHFHALAGFPFGVEGQVDLAHRTLSGTVTLADWKSGDDLGEGDDSLQLAVYAFWATAALSCEGEAIILYKAFLGSGTLVEFPLSERLLKVARLKIFQDAEGFARMHEYGCAGVVEAFTPCAQEAVCRGCPFATLCPAGEEYVTW